MTTVTAGSSGSYTFNAGESVTVTLDPAEQAQVSILTSAGVQKSGTVVTSTRTIGPFSAGDVMTITAQRGDVDYTVTPAVASSSAPIAGLTNAAALKGVAAALRGALSAEVIITGTGDSLTQFGGDTTAQTSDTLAEQSGYLACLRRELNSRMGLSSYDGGQWISPDAVVADTRVANGGSPPVVAQFNPYVGWRNSSSVVTERKAISLESGTHTITFTFTGRYLNVMQWENAGSSYNGTFSYNIDGAGANNIVSSGATDTYRLNRIDCTTNAAHTVVLTWVSAKVLIAGAMVTNGAGISTARFGVGSTTASDWTGRAEKQQRTSFKTLSSALHIIRFSYNDWNRQVSSGITPTTFAASVTTLIALAQLNSANKAVLLLADPPTSTADTLTNSYDSYRAALQSLAVGTVAFFDVKAATNSAWAIGNTNGLYVDFVHRTAAGYAVEAAALAAALLDTSLLLT